MPESAQKLLNELTAAGILSSAEITKFDSEVQVGVDALLERLVQDNRITRYQADKFKAGKSSDIYFGDYVVLEELGRGGMGTVLLAKHRRMEREVAIKILPVTALDSESAVARFYQEVKVAAQLTHPNIVHAYDAGEHHGFHYLVMEYVRGHDLAKVLEQLGPIPIHMALDYIAQAANGLDYAHRKGVVHRDIKPSNMLLDDEGVLKILDMGLARIGTGIGTEASMHLTTTGQVMGTVEYMSPEQAEDTRVADARSDIYSLGCTLYRLVTGAAPFSRDTVVKTILAHRESPIPLMAVGDDIAITLLNPLFQRMVAKNPEHRFQNTGELLHELNRVAAQVGQQTPGPPLSSPSSKPVSVDSPTILPDSGSTSPESRRSPSEMTIAETSLGSGGYANQAGYNPQIGSGSNVMASQQSHSNVHPGMSYVPSSGVGLPQGMSNPRYVGIKHHRGKTILTLGIIACIFSMCFIGGVLGVVNWIYANSDLKEINQGLRDGNGKTLTFTGKVLSIISVGIVGLTYVVIPIMGALFD